MRQLQAGHDEELEKMKERLTAEHNQYIDSLRNEHCTQIDTLNVSNVFTCFMQLSVVFIGGNNVHIFVVSCGLKILKDMF